MNEKQKPARKNSRWNVGGPRYDATTTDTINRKYKEQHGWRQGARVTKRQPS